GDFFRSMGRWQEALEDYQQDLLILERLSSTDATNSNWRHDILRSYGRVGHALAALDQPTQSIDVLRLGVDAAKTFVSTWPTRVDWKIVSGLFQELCHTLGKRGSASEALAVADEGLLVLTNRDSSFNDNHLQLA